ncbi:MAG: hypothetical protein Q9217_007107, partial [Psora testacea]
MVGVNHLEIGYAQRQNLSEGGRPADPIWALTYDRVGQGIGNFDTALQAELAACAALVAEAVADAGADTAPADAAEDVLNDQTALPEGSLTTALTPFARADAADLAAQKAGAGGA